MENHAYEKTGNLSFEEFKRVFFEDPELLKQKTIYNLNSTPKSSDSEKKSITEQVSRKRS